MAKKRCSGHVFSMEKEKRIEILSGGIDEKGAVAYNDGTSGRRVAAFLRK